MYKNKLYGKEWHWRNVKMETRDAAYFFCYKLKRDLSYS